MKTISRAIPAGVILFALFAGAACGNGGGPTLDNGVADALDQDQAGQLDANGQELVVNPDAIGRDTTGQDLAGTDTAGTDTHLGYDTNTGTDNGDGDDAVVLPDCTDSAQCAFGNICIDKHCVPGCNGDRDCQDGLHCDTDVGPHGSCRQCVQDAHCDVENDQKCRNGLCVATCATPEDCAATPTMPHCEPLSETCVACLTDSHCPEGRLCIDYDCVVGCHGDRDCPDELRCDPKVAPNGDCFECVADTDCGARVCRDHQCVIDCDAVNCPVERPVCDPATGNCFQCMQKDDCGAGRICIANTCISGCENDDDCGDRYCSGGSCVECTSDLHCAGGKKCRANTCSAAECFKDSDCSPGDYCHPLLYSCEDLPNGYCSSSADCVSWIPGLLDEYCDPLTRECVAACLSGFCLDLMGSGRDTCIDGGCYGCSGDADCAGVRCSPYDRFCRACQDDEDCSVPGWVCGQDGACYECLDDWDCPDGKVCDAADSNRCVECLVSKDCTTGAKPVCGKSKTCIPACSHECEPGEMICNPDDATYPITALTCGDTDDDPCYEYGGYYSCGNGASCVTGVDDQGECVCDNECSSSQSWCAAGDTDVVETCKQDATSGCWYISTSYCYGSYGEKCSGGQCVCSNECTVDQSVCTSTTAYKKCVEDYYTGCPYWSSYTCSSGYYCSSGKCQ